MTRTLARVRYLAARDAYRAALADLRASEGSLADQALIDRILVTVAQGFAVSTDDLLGRGHSARLCEARHVAIWLIHHQTGAAFREIGRDFDLHHTGARHAVRKVNDRRSIDRSFAARVDRLVAATDAELLTR